MPWEKIQNTDLYIASLLTAIKLYQEKEKVLPTTLCVNPDLAHRAYKIIKEETFQHLFIVPIPGLPACSWFICGGTNHVVYSEGA